MERKMGRWRSIAIRGLGGTLALASVVCFAGEEHDVSNEIEKCDKEKYSLPADVRPFPAEGESYFNVYRVPSRSMEAGTPILLLHELPGLNCKAIRLAHQLADAGFTVYLPHLLGEAGEDNWFLNSVALLFDSRWKAYSTSLESLIVKQLDKLTDHIHRETSKQLGVIGMCLTGAFPIALMRHPGVGAVVVAQPATPLLAMTEARKASLGISAERIESASERLDVPILGFRYAADKKISPRAKFDTLNERFPNFNECEISLQEVEKSKQGHSVLTEQYGRVESNRRVAKTIEFLDLVLRKKTDLQEFVCPEPRWGKN